MKLSPGGLRLLTIGLAATGFALAAITILPRGVFGEGGLGDGVSGGGDAYAYWLAGRAVVAGTELYGAQPGDLGAYLYPPLFAQLVAPLAWLLPADGFIWLIRAFGLAGLVVAAGGWTRAGITLLVFPPAIIELETANVNLLVAAACALLMRGSARWLPATLALKLAGFALLPLALLRDRRGLLQGGLVVLGAVGVSIVVAGGAWFAYVDFLGAAQPSTYWTNLGAGIPIWLRLVVALAIGLLAVRWIRLAPFAMLAGLPTLSLNALAVLVAVPTPLRGGSAQRVVASWPLDPRLSKSHAAGEP